MLVIREMLYNRISTNREDPDETASSEAFSSGSALFVRQLNNVQNFRTNIYHKWNLGLLKMRQPYQPLGTVLKVLRTNIWVCVSVTCTCQTLINVLCPFCLFVYQPNNLSVCLSDSGMVALICLI